MEDSEFIPISALQHFIFCPRQCALIHLEQAWAENQHTAEGVIFHKAAHSGKSKIRGSVRTTTDLQIKSVRLGLTGRSDAVEFEGDGDDRVPYLVEYKKGNKKNHLEADSIQLCAEALCMEEMLGCAIKAGALYYGEARHRVEVVFDEKLRSKTEKTVDSVRELFKNGVTPPPLALPHCAQCSLNEFCMPNVTARGDESSRYLQSLWEGGV